MIHKGDSLPLTDKLDNSGTYLLIKKENKKMKTLHRFLLYIKKPAIKNSLIFRYSGFSTEGESERVRFVGPRAPQTNRGIPGKK